MIEHSKCSFVQKVCLFLSFSLSLSLFLSFSFSLFLSFYLFLSFFISFSLSLLSLFIFFTSRQSNTSHWLPGHSLSLCSLSISGFKVQRLGLRVLGCRSRCPVAGTLHSPSATPEPYTLNPERETLNPTC